jgi:signal transduction histidine kinase/ligand-binding sensor domain-containing protein/CheY-like chemotaxis protein
MKRAHWVFHWVFRAALLGCASVAAASSGGLPLILENLSTRDGLPQGDVLVTLQDSQGFVWIGTEDGLVRFDGHEIYRYAYSPTAAGGLPGNFINAIAEDKHADLWIGIKGGGLARWSRATDTFTVYRHDPADADSISSNAVHRLMVDSRGWIWIGTLDAGIDVLDPGSGHIRHFRHEPGRANSLIDDQIHALLQDHSGAIWVGTHAGLERVVGATDDFVHYNLQGDLKPAVGDQISRIIEDHAGSLWVGTFDAGLFQLDRAGNVLARFRHDSAQVTSLSGNDVRAILDDNVGHLWVGTSEGLDLLDRESREFSHYRHDKSDPDSLADSYIMSLYKDSAGLLWIGTRAGGVARWNPHSWELGANRPEWLDGKLVTAFADAPDNRLWIGSLGGGLVQFDAATGQSINLDTLLNQHNAIGDTRVMSLLQDRHGALWIGTMANGLKRLSDGKIVSIPVKSADAHSLSAAGIMSIFEARDGRLWIGTHGGGADILDLSTGTVNQLPYASRFPGALSAENITSFEQDREGNIWIGTDSGGLDLAREDGTVVKVFKHEPKDPQSLSANTVYSLAMDGSGRIWIATDGGGLDLVVGSSSAPDGIRFRNISVANGLSSDTIYSVLNDAAGRLWLSGNAGLMRYDPATEAVKTYHREHGLQGEEFDSGAYYRTRDGRLCFGGPGGFNVFDPSRLTERRTPPRVVLTHLDVLGAPAKNATPYWLMNRVDLGYRANIVSLDFSALDFTSLNKNQIAYRMPGLTDDWINLGSLRRVTLTNLEAGDHVLEVRALNAESVWSTQPLRLVIHKEAAPWRSTAAYSAYVLAFLALIMIGMRAQRNKLRHALDAKHRLESEVELRTQELRDTNHQLVVASEAKSSFLARMSHELRTPMNGVVGMTELLARSSLTEVQARQTRTIRSSARTLLQILNDLLDLSKVQAGKVELETVPLDLVQIGEECAALFTGSAETKGVDLIVCPPPGTAWNLLGDPLRIRQILMNLIGNAVKFTARGEIVVTCDVNDGDEGVAEVTLRVADTGIGMTHAAMGKIFEPFSQADETTTRRFGGTGLGLSICREFAELMGGSIAVESVPQLGSTFRVSLPLKIAGPRAQPDQSFTAGPTIRLLTRRPALAMSLSRYFSGITASRFIEVHEFPSNAPDQSDILVLDADSCPEVLDELKRRTADAPLRLMVIGSGDSIDAHGLESWLRSDQVIRKPLCREALRDALAMLLDQEGSQQPIVAADASPTVAAKAHVLIVEDEGVNAAVAEGYLAELGCTSVWVDNGTAAVARSGVERFDLILMDLNMPGLDGYAVTALIRKSEQGGARIPIVALTANEASVYRESCLLAGMDDILSKPYSLPEFSALLGQWLKHLHPPVSPHSPQPDGRQSRTPRAEARCGLASLDAATIAGLERVQSRGRADLYATLVALFESNSVEALRQIELALSSHDLAAAAALAHKLKASAANVGALEFSAAAAELERYCNANDGEAARAPFARISAAHPSLIDELKALLLRATA